MPQGLIVDAAIEVILEGQADDIVFLKPCAAVPTNLRKRPNEKEPNDPECSQQSDQPEVVWVCTELLLLNDANFSRHKLLKDVSLENGRQAIHEEEPANMTQQDELVIAMDTLGQVVVKLYWPSVASQEQALVHPVGDEKKDGGRGVHDW